MTGQPETSGALREGEALGAPDETCEASRHDASRAAHKAGCRCPGAIDANRAYYRAYYVAARSLPAFRERHNEATRLSKRRQRADPESRERINARNRRWAQLRRERDAHDRRHMVDDVLVLRATGGELARLNRAERLEAVRWLHDHAVPYREMAARLNVNARQVHRDLADLGLIVGQGAVA